MNKKFYLIITTIILSLLLISCGENNVEEDADLLTIIEVQEKLQLPVEDLNAVTTSFELPLEIDGVSISWHSDEPTVVNSSGNVTRLLFDVTVELTATLTKGQHTRTKKFTLIVIKKESDEVEVFEYKIQLPSTELLQDASDIEIIEDAPDLLILGVVLDTYYYFQYDTMSGFEYIKVYNNTEQPYNLKNHKISLANPLQGQNGEDKDVRVGNKAIATGFLFNSLIDEDVFIPAKSIILIWLKPYYWTAGSGTGAYNKPFTTEIVYKDSDGKKGAFNQTTDDFKSFWKMEDSDIEVYAATNMAIVGIRPEGGTDGMFPIITPGGGTGFTHLNGTLLRSLEISKFNDQGGSASISLLNKYSKLTPDKQQDPDLIYGKKIFNVIEIKDNNEVVDGYLFTNTWKYFDPIIKINFLGLIDLSTIAPGQEFIDFLGTSNPGVKGWENTVELQFRPPVVGERIMQLQLPLRELAKYQQYLLPAQMEVMRFSSENVTTYRFIEKTILLTVDPANGLEYINWRTDEIYSEGRSSSASPTKIKTINITRP